MEEPGNVFPQQTLLKAVIMGDVSTGKTAFINQFISENDINNFVITYKQSFGVQFAVKKFSLDNSKTVLLQMWDVAGTEKFSNVLRVYFKSGSIFFIVISADSMEDTKFKQIEDWLKKIQDYKDQDSKIILIETKSDLETATPLTAQQIAKFVKKDKSVEQNEELSCDAYMLISSKNKTNFPALEQLLSKMFYELEPTLKRPNEVEPILQQPQPPQIVEDDVTRDINFLEDNQAEQLLFFVEHSIRKGTTTDVFSKPYELTWFSGTPYKYKSIMDSESFEPEIELYFPKHIPELLELVKQKGRTSAKVILCQIYSKTLEIARLDSFTRKSSTQYFYQHYLPNYYKHSLLPATLDIYKNINKLSDEQANEVIQKIRKQLLLGALNNEEKPYKLGFFGGVNFKNNNVTIKLPHSVDSILHYIDGTIEILDKPKGKRLLMYIYEFILSSALLPKSSRDLSTQQFYETSLPGYIQINIAAYIIATQQDRQVTSAMQRR